MRKKVEKNVSCARQKIKQKINLACPYASKD